MEQSFSGGCMAATELLAASKSFADKWPIADGADSGKVGFKRVADA